MEFNSREIELPSGKKYSIPHLPEDAKRSDCAPIDYFIQRIKTACDYIRRRIEVTTREGHNRSKQQSEIDAIDQLERNAKAVVAAFDFIGSIGALDRLCGELHSGPVRAYKTRNEQQKMFTTLLNEILKAEREAIEKIFDLPKRYDPANGETAKHPEEVIIHSSPDEQKRRETEALVNRVIKHSERYRQLEKLHEILLSELNKIIDRLKPLEDLHIELRQHFNAVKNKKEKAKESLEEAEKKVPEIQSALRIVSTPQVLEGLPPRMQDATLDTYRNYIALFPSTHEFKVACAKTRESINRFNKEKNDFQTILSDNQLNFLLQHSTLKVVFGERYEYFIKLKEIFEKLIQETKEVSEVVDDAEKEIKLLLKKEKIEETLSQVAPFVNEGFQLVIQQLFESDSEELNGKEAKEASEKKSGTRKRGKFPINSASSEEIVDEMVRRITKRRPGFKDLISQGKWEEVRKVLNSIKASDLKLKFGYSPSWRERIGTYKKDTIFAKLFPDAYPETNVEPLK